MAEYRKPKEKDLYSILGVERGADGAQIKKAYRKLAKKYHPDSNKGDSAAEKKFKDISEANAILGDPEKRKIYDEFGYAAFESGMDPKEYAKRMHEAKAAGFGGAGGFGNFGGSFRGFGGAGAEGGSGSRGRGREEPGLSGLDPGAARIYRAESVPGSVAAVPGGSVPLSSGISVPDLP